MKNEAEMTCYNHHCYDIDTRTVLSYYQQHIRLIFNWVTAYSVQIIYQMSNGEEKAIQNHCFVLNTTSYPILNLAQLFVLTINHYPILIKK